MTILIFIIILAILVLSHELGHFFFAKMFGIRVDEFGFGFPPKLFSFKRGETVYSINLLPFGGFVKIFGEDPTTNVINKEHQDFERSLYHKPKHVQALVILGGILFNIVLAWLALSIGFMSGLPVPADFTSFGPKPEDSKLLITEVLSGSPAELAGLKSGYSIVSLATKDTVLENLNPELVSDFISSHNGEEIYVGYEVPLESNTLIDIGLGPLDYNAEIKNLIVIPQEGIIGSKSAIGVAMGQVGILKLPFFKSLYAGILGVNFLFKSTALGLINFVTGFFIGSSVTASVSGPIGLIGIVGSAVHFGFSYVMALIALISVNLAVLNLVPFPALDGGRLFFLLIEFIIRRPLDSKIVNALNFGGFVFLLFLMLFVTYGDIVKLIR